MDYKRKKRWVTYYHIKCKMYLRNDFRFECAYCRMWEQDTGVLGEDYFEKDHFAARTSGAKVDLDSYDNMIYACSKCNGKKSNKSVELLLDPCKDDIYLGASPHIKNLGEKGYYELIGNTDAGQRFIDTLQLNSKFYREMRERQEQANKDNSELESLINTISNCKGIPNDLPQKLRRLVHNNFPSPTNHQQDFIFRCGHSKAGQAVQEVMDVLGGLSIPFELLFDDEDIDIRIQYNNKEYLCEIALNENAEKPVGWIHMKKEQREWWAAKEGNHGVLYYYMKTGRLEFFSVADKIDLPVCLRNC